MSNPFENTPTPAQQFTETVKQYMGHEGAEFTDLLAKLEKATGPDRMIDGAVMAVVNPPGSLGDEPANIFIRFDGDGLGVFKTFVGTPLSFKKPVPEYTASIDAALTLVPEFVNRRWYIADSDDRSNGRAVATVYHPLDILSGRIPRYEGATPAIALCVAALRARHEYRAAA